jgi:uncharacterized protein (DUF885 family)
MNLHDPLRRRLLQGTVPFALAPWLAACATAPGGAGSQDAAFLAWSEGFAQDWVRLSPQRATSTQYFSGKEEAALDRELTPVTPAQRARTLALARSGLVALAGFSPAQLSAGNAAAAATLRWALQREVDGAPFQDHRFAFDQNRGPQVQLVSFLTVTHPMRRPADIDSYLARLAQVATRLDEALARAEAAAASGLKPPRFIAERARGQVAAFLAHTATSNPFLASLARRSDGMAGLSDEARNNALAHAKQLVHEQVRPAYQRLLTWLNALLPQLNDDAGLWRLPQGEAAYTQALAANTSTQLDAREVHAIGLREVARLEAEMDTVLKRLGRELNSVTDRMRVLTAETQPAPEPDPRPALLARYTDYVREVEERARPLFNRIPKAPVEVQRVPALTERTSSAYYTTPAPDGSRPGVFWVPLPGPSYNVLGMKSLAVHEAVPGHHFQLALLQEQAGAPRWQQRRIFSGGSANSEGWALYAEALAIEQGWYEGDDLSLLGALNAQLFRARRLVVDTGLHALRWTRQQAIDYGISASEVERYVVNPGQACAYMIGMLHILKLREQAKQALGARFTLPDFHDVVLQAGSVPLDVLSEVVAAWTADATRA